MKSFDGPGGGAAGHLKRYAQRVARQAAEEEMNAHECHGCATFAGVRHAFVVRGFEDSGWGACSPKNPLAHASCMESYRSKPAFWPTFDSFQDGSAALVVVDPKGVEVPKLSRCCFNVTCYNSLCWLRLCQ